MRRLMERMAQKVAPYAGAWIEIRRIAQAHRRGRSRPTRARGLKYWTLDEDGMWPGRALRGRVA